MTLTIAVVNYRVAFLSSDFRLTATAAPSACLPASPKLLQVSRRQLDALVAYCGLGSIGKVQTNDWLAEQFRSSTSDSLASTLEQVRANAANFISHAPPNQRALTIVLCGITEGRTFLASISNHERMDGTRESARGSFSLELEYPKQTLVFVPGGWSRTASWKRVAGQNSELLHKAVSRGRDHPQRVIATLGDMTRQVAESPDSGGLVSPQCHAGYRLADRTGATRVFGSVKTWNNNNDPSKFFSNPCYSHVVGAVGVWNEGELASVPGGRCLAAGTPVAPVGLTAAKSTAAIHPPRVLGHELKAHPLRRRATRSRWGRSPPTLITT